jgi:hypothetical protein
VEKAREKLRGAIEVAFDRLSLERFGREQMASYQWFPKERDYEAEKAENALARTLSTANHPLKPNSKNESEEAANASPLASKGSSGSVSTKRVTSTFIDPLSAGDPLSAPQPTPSSNITTMYESGSMTRSTSSPLVARKASAKRGQYYDQEEDPTFVPWSMKKKDILTVYTTDEQVGIQMVRLPPLPCLPSRKSPKSSSATVVLMRDFGESCRASWRRQAPDVRLFFYSYYVITTIIVIIVIIIYLIIILIIVCRKRKREARCTGRALG